MTRTNRVFIFLAALLLMGSVAWAQSSGNFSAAGNGSECLIATDGSLTTTGPAGCLTGPFTTATGNINGCTTYSAAIKTSSGNGVTLLITPSAVTGLFTDTKLTTTVSSSTAEVGIQMCVNITDANGNEVGTVYPNVGGSGGAAGGTCAIYDERFQSISNTLFSQLTSGNFDLLLTTLSAHSFNFIAQVPNGTNNVNVSWNVIDINAVGNASVAACVGPSDVTVTQTKIFNNSGSLSF
jgi:hypothetical protein